MSIVVGDWDLSDVKGIALPQKVQSAFTEVTSQIVGADYEAITGLMKGYVLKEWSSEIGFNGIARKVYMFMFVGMANIVGHELPILGFGNPETLRDAVATFYLANEAISIIENGIDIGVPIPEGFKSRFMDWRNRQLISSNDKEVEEKHLKISKQGE